MFIRSERLFLRPGWPEDWEELLSRIQDEAVVMNLAKAPWPYTADDARWFARQPQDARLPHFFVTQPTRAAPAEIIGSVGLARGDEGVELGYWLAYARQEFAASQEYLFMIPWNCARLRLAALWPWLWLGQWLHVGKNATMGMGGYALQP